jgi:U3 small nucleolar RNA-associated protein MPP10
MFVLDFRGKCKVDLRALTKCIYDFTKEQEEHRKTNALPELITQDFDEEQIWQQVELQNENVLTPLFIGVSKVLTNKQLTIPVSSVEPEHKLVETTNDELSQEDDDDISDDISDDILQDSEDENKLKSNLRKRKIKQKTTKSSIVDDKFFKLEELDEYLNKEERKEERNNLESDDESVDLFNDFSEEEDEDNENRYVKYADFFDSPESDNEQYKANESLGDNFDDEEGSENEVEMSDDEEDKEPKDKKVRFNLTNDSDETDSLDNKANQEKQYTSENKTDLKEESQSNLELRQERVLQRIKELEEEAIQEKPWQLKGEVSGLNRPQNSLLEEFVEFDMTRRPAPVITEETTIKLEDIIKQRIKDKTWDDVEKKFKPVETPLEYKKKLILDQEKSKESLSQIYEKEYLKQKQALNPENNEKKEEMPESHKKIQERMHSLMNKLDALCNYHFTPKRVRFTSKFGGFKIYLMRFYIII